GRHGELPTVLFQCENREARRRAPRRGGEEGDTLHCICPNAISITNSRARFISGIFEKLAAEAARLGPPLSNTREEARCHILRHIQTSVCQRSASSSPSSSSGTPSPRPPSSSPGSPSHSLQPSALCCFAITIVLLLFGRDTREGFQCWSFQVTTHLNLPQAVTIALANAINWCLLKPTVPAFIYNIPCPTFSCGRCSCFYI
ncbi:hypothetical protein U9M48_037021, partial [Paspalum notatum var. saurae]